MTKYDYEKIVSQLLPGRKLECSGPRRYWIDASQSELAATVAALRDQAGLWHLATISGEDMRDHFLLNYHLAGEVVITLRVRVEKDKPEFPSLANVVAGALVYERELYDILGLTPVGHPDLRRQAVPDDWPDGVFPLRKDVKFPRATLDDAETGE